MADWKEKLTDLFEKQSRERCNQNIKPDAATKKLQKKGDEFLCSIVDPALRDLAAELYKYERKACTFGGSKLSREMEVRFQNRVEFRYVINVYIGAIKTTVHTSYQARYQSGREEQGEAMIMKDGKQVDISDITKDDIIDNFMKQYIVRESHCSC
jgi:hypothetical protein